MLTSLRSYLGLKPSTIDEKNAKSYLGVLLPLALKKFVSELNKRFEQGIAVSELITEEESKMFTPIWASMVNDLYNDVKSNVKMDDAKLTAKFLALKDLSELLAASSASYNSSYISIYTEAKYMMDETAIKAKEDGLMDEDVITESYNKDAELKYRAGRLESNIKVY
jgi:hypothetical protein